MVSGNIGLPAILRALVALAAIMAVAGCSTVDKTTADESAASGKTHSITADTTEDILYIESLLEHPAKSGAIDRLYAAIENFDHNLAQRSHDEKAIVRMRYWRAVAYLFLNELRERNGESPNRAEAQKALADFDYVIRSIDASSYRSVHYFAGHAAYNHLRDEDLAVKHWLQCADDKHAGCMNIVADGYFTGRFGLEVDYAKSRDFHARVFETGTKYNCAGVFSGFFLAKMSVFLPELEYQLTWDERLSLVFEMQEELADKHEFAETCALNTLNLEAYLLYLANGRNKTELLDHVLSTSPNPVNLATASYFLGVGSRSAVEDLLQDKTDDRICQVITQLHSHSTILQTVETIDFGYDTITNSDTIYCASARQWMKIMDAYEPADQ